MKKDKKIIIILISLIIVTAILIFIFKGTYSLGDEFTAEDARLAVIETADAYYRKGINIQYDDYRRQNYMTPEEATEQNTLYMVCNNFVYNVYYQTFGITLPMGRTKESDPLVTYTAYYPYAKALLGGDNAPDRYISEDANGHVLYWAKNNDVITADLADDEFIATLTDSILPGDIVNIYRDTEDNDTWKQATGHTMMVKAIENGKIVIINSSGSNYNANTQTEKLEDYEVNSDFHEGTVRIKEDLIEYLQGENTKVSDSGVRTRLKAIAIVRIITDDLKFPDFNDVNQEIALNMTDSAKTRLKYPDMDVSKVYSVETQTNHDNRIVELNDIIKYTITIKNNSNESYEDIVVDELLSNYVTFVEDSQTENSNISFDRDNFTWTIDTILAGDTVTISYKVKVNFDTNNLGKNIISNGTVDDIANTPITNVIGINLSDSQKESLATAIMSEFSSQKTNENYSYRELDFIKKLYQDVGLHNLIDDIGKLYNEDEDVKNVSDMISLTTDNNCQMIVDNKWNKYCRYRYNVDENIKDIVLLNNYGIRISGSEAVDEETKEEEISDGGIYVSSDTVYWFSAWNLYAHKDTEYYDDRARSIRNEELETGDIIISYSYSSIPEDDISQVHIYNGYQFFRSSEVGRNIYAYTIAYTPKFLNNLVGDNYIIIRPSLAYDYYTITFDSNGGTGSMDSILVNMDETITLTNNAYTRKGYLFKEWNTKADGTGTTYNNAAEVTKLTSENHEEITLYAMWEENTAYTINNYVVDENNNYINMIPVGTNSGEFEDNFVLGVGYTLEVEYLNDKVYTGGKTKIYENGTLYKEFTNIVKGDITGSGEFSIDDAKTIARHIVDGDVITEDEYLLAADYNNDGNIKMNDAIKMAEQLIK